MSGEGPPGWISWHQVEQAELPASVAGIFRVRFGVDGVSRGQQRAGADAEPGGRADDAAVADHPPAAQDARGPAQGVGSQVQQEAAR